MSLELTPEQEEILLVALGDYLRTRQPWSPRYEVAAALQDKIYDGHHCENCCEGAGHKCDFNPTGRAD